jgi:phosphoglycolate phosphatase-like HAD superfamily hydrolase
MVLRPDLAAGLPFSSQRIECRQRRKIIDVLLKQLRQKRSCVKSFFDAVDGISPRHYNSRMQILLFDIDGTLVNTGGAGGAALRTAFRDTFHVDDAGKVAFSGRTDRAIVRSFFDLHGMESTDENWCRVRDAYLQRLPHFMPRHQGHVLPGVRELLDALRHREDTVLGLLTGNLRDGAQIKLEFYNIDHYFAFGGFGDEHYERDEVARDALNAALDHVNGHASPHHVWVIGDTPLDVACARVIGANVLAVTTGIHPREELLPSRPDVLLDSLVDTSEVLGILLPEATG